MPETTRLQRLLVATDLSSRADRAFGRAIELARANKARLTVLHVIPDELQPDYAEDLKSRARSALEMQVAQSMAAGELDVDIAVKGGLDVERILKQVKEGAERGDLSVEVRIEAGSIYDLINETAAESNADLIVCGAHRKLMIGDDWLGSTMDRVLRFGSRPVLIVKTPPDAPYHNIVVAVDLSEPSAQALEFALAAFPGAKFTFVNAVESSFSGFLAGAGSDQEALTQRREELRKFAEATISRAKEVRGISADELRLEVKPGSPTDVLLQHVADNQNDLAVLGTHGRSGLRLAILGSVAGSAIARLPCDVLAVRPQSA